MYRVIIQSFTSISCDIKYFYSRVCQLAVSSAYGSAWYLLDPKDRRAMILMIISQRQLTIIAGKFVDLSMDAFAKVSYLLQINVLLKVYRIVLRVNINCKAENKLNSIFSNKKFTIFVRLEKHI